MNDVTEAPRPRQMPPAGGRRRVAHFPKGRVLRDEERQRLAAILGERPRDKHLLIEHLHLIQEAEGHLPAGLLQALGEALGLPMAAVYEVATFYAHFDVVADGEAAPPPITVRVCESLSCAMAGAEDLIAAMEAHGGTDVRVLRAPCMGRCDTAPVAEVGHRHVDRASAESVAAVVASDDHHPRVPDYQRLDAYRDAGGYEVLRQCLGDERTVDDVLATLSDGGLRGLGGAGFPTGKKWGFVRAAPAPRLMAVNADEGEPGTFKDRYYLEREPHAFLEGMLIAAWAVEAREVYVYLRDEYPAAREILLAEIAALRGTWLADHTRIVLRRGAGAYICGEESAMIESIEGKRGYPRHRPPYVAQRGIFGRPTLVNNVETLHWVPQILARGADWFAGQGVRGAKGLRSYSVSGRVANPQVVVAPAGSTVGELIERCGGMAEGHTFKGYLPGGASGGILPASMADLPLEFGTLEKHGSFVGSHAVVVLSDHDDVTEAAINLMHFFETESCGQCTPCRVGTEKAVTLMQRRVWDADTLGELSQTMRDASICGLGQAASNPLLSVLEHFADDVAERGRAEDHIFEEGPLGEPPPGGEEYRHR